MNVAGSHSPVPYFSTHRTSSSFSFFFFNDTATTEIYTLSLHDALPISPPTRAVARGGPARGSAPPPASGPWKGWSGRRSEEHTSELQSQSNLVCRLLLEKKKKKKQAIQRRIR